jgi:hypothetical protein
VLRYDHGTSEGRRYAPIAAKSPLLAWPHPARPDAFRVRSDGAKNVEEYGLSRLPNADAGAPAPAQAASVQALPDFDAQLFAVLADGVPLYSTPQGLVRREQGARAIPTPGASAPVTLLFADASPRRFWTAGASSELALFDLQQAASPLLTANVPGVVIDSALEGDRAAVLSLELAGGSYRPTVTVFANGKEQARLTIGSSFTLLGQPKLDLCLIAGQPWVVVGGPSWMQLLDWDSRRLLAEW